MYNTKGHGETTSSSLQVFIGEATLIRSKSSWKSSLILCQIFTRRKFKSPQVFIEKPFHVHSKSFWRNYVSHSHWYDHLRFHTNDKIYFYVVDPYKNAWNMFNLSCQIAIICSNIHTNIIYFLTLVTLTKNIIWKRINMTTWN